MKGLVYKDFSLFYKSIDKKLVIIAAAAIILLLVNAGDFSGLLATIMFAMTVGMQNVMSFASDEQVRWKKYQLTMPVNSFLAVGSKYVSVLLTIGLSIVASIFLYFVAGIIYQSFDGTLLFVSISAAIIIPLIWTAICLPLTYWFGFRSAQTMGLLVIIPIFYLIKYFEDGPGLVSLTDTISTYILAGFLIAIILFIFSYIVSVLGYSRKN